MAKRPQNATPTPLDADWFRPDDGGWYELDLLLRATFSLDAQGVYVIGCQKRVKTSGGTHRYKYETISVGEGDIGQRLAEKAADEKVVRRANGRKMYATFEFLDDETNDYRRAVELSLGRYYELDKLGDRFHTSLAPVPVNSPWPK